MAKSDGRAVKKARISQPIDAKRVKGSPRPPKAKKSIKTPLQSDLDPISANEKGKGKAKETVSKPRSKKQSLKDASSDALPTTFKIIAGSYEKLLYGLEGTVVTSESSSYTFNLKPMFIFPAHVSCIKAVAASPMGGKWLATGSADEIVKVWDLRRRKEIGGLMHHEGMSHITLFMSRMFGDRGSGPGSITHLSFPSRSHLLSASEDGTLCLFRARDWAVLRSLHGHKGRVNSVAVHPSGKVALSVGKDKTLRMWDLMRGKGSASTKLGKGWYLILCPSCFI
jgi:protein MAK11